MGCSHSIIQSCIAAPDKHLGDLAVVVVVVEKPWADHHQLQQSPVTLVWRRVCPSISRSVWRRVSWSDGYSAGPGLLQVKPELGAQLSRLRGDRWLPSLSAQLRGSRQNRSCGLLEIILALSGHTDDKINKSRLVIQSHNDQSLVHFKD